ncbi:DUF4190 domain-containing protein [Streptomyces sp. NPDC049954]|uniref:DUF4190 domain-containing protein n=1 Tax=Streptomyces sp. NPDC049954 TaxID=3155779 RepID=UPI0034251340
MTTDTQFSPGRAAAAHADETPGADRPNGQATAALVCGVLGLVLVPVVLPVAALVLGAAGGRRADRGEAGGRGRATAGIVLGIVGCAVAVLGIVVAVMQYAGTGSL